MSGARGDAGADAFLDGSRSPALLEKIDVLLPGYADHQAQPVFRSRVEQPRRRKRVRAQRVESALRHVGEVAGDHSRLGVELAASIGTEGAVCRTLHAELVLTREQELAPHVRTRGCPSNTQRRAPPAMGGSVLARVCLVL